MNKNTFIAIVILIGISFKSFSQIELEKGYFINEVGVKTDCLIKNFDWNDNPSEFKYQLFENSKLLSASINNVKEFGIYNISKYVRYIVKIDKSSEDVESMSNEKEPIFVEETLFLKVLIEGKANLYVYANNGLERFFYVKDTNKIEQLVCKNYLLSSNEIAKNNEFKQQLWQNLKCSSVDVNEIDMLNYNTKNLLHFLKNTINVMILIALNLQINRNQNSSVYP